ncbi:hypothetical protein Y900_004385 [Mycolicibacterium aromaticivorans JS19b1 = JCM 16368]|uniref:Uncharacterized protein n=1 Tax=Mycolicibacterium aromaticivorans JS19b1 = JCM 16368 TaxID=1440774 RepID=Z5X6E0_9MYCO|nr:hypothetical protein [Mycolicibacterium aromaticivorans]KDE96922.1 hypothetical protein Y900_030275 [Mycolicibacterium aromaticivorans JS19b1 = JCM 16368]KDE97070.1 hypothetical protein Y900_027670 [Mycolicibacterium aromaticivorans JS19b1 = JCM 16368]KDE98199.1 hypothetical protein Y900_004385 [Mycolicibacterium aromaticivorans JS19b1 = JCM 16368]
MSNPAQLLHAKFLSWRGPQNVNAASARGLNGQNWDDHTLAISHLREIEELIGLLESQGRNMRVAREAVPTWYQVVFSFSGGWQGQGTATIDQTSLNTLEMLAERLEDVVPTLEADGIDRINGYIESVAETLKSDPSIPAPLRAHINDVIAHVRWCTQNYATVGDFSLQDALERLAGAVVRGAANSTDKSKWKSAVNNIVWPFAVNMMAALPAAELVALVTGH